MNFEPLILTRAERLSDEPISRWRKFWHYAPQVVRQMPALLQRISKKVWRQVCKHWMISMVISCVGVVYLFVCIFAWLDEVQVKKKSGVQQLTVAQNEKATRVYAEAWKAAFLGDRQAVCFESYNTGTLEYTIACHIGEKGVDPKKILQCHEYGCEYKDL